MVFTLRESNVAIGNLPHWWKVYILGKSSKNWRFSIATFNTLKVFWIGTNMGCERLNFKRFGDTSDWSDELHSYFLIGTFCTYETCWDLGKPCWDLSVIWVKFQCIRYPVCTRQFCCYKHLTYRVLIWSRACNFLFTFAWFGFVPCWFTSWRSGSETAVPCGCALWTYLLTKLYRSLILYWGPSMQLHLDVAETQEILMF